MDAREDFIIFRNYGRHKGFYNDDNYLESLIQIKYTDFFDEHNDDEFPYYAAENLLNGSCNHFAVSLKNICNYNVYVIQEIKNRGFHAFCQIYKNEQWYYVDVRGITSSFDEFINGIKTFVGNEFTIRSMSPDDLIEWEKDFNYNDEAYAFAEAMIKKYYNYYTF